MVKEKKKKNGENVCFCLFSSRGMWETFIYCVSVLASVLSIAKALFVWKQKYDLVVKSLSKDVRFVDDFEFAIDLLNHDKIDKTQVVLKRMVSQGDWISSFYIALCCGAKDIALQCIQNMHPTDIKHMIQSTLV